ncbi:PREDICTED: granzyme-like protein 2 [Ceratotherium simum simum]|uniref:Granzyme-like protein 2 n=1 Tax=Ceratotherium simum simum TaxID=73337 RepID=A0ABM1C8P5_CERSS|nr:PREDICTED: granzyme-like protein 2 [Ceratotherium simum simum]
MLLLLLLLTNLLPSRAKGGEIRWGREARPHSRPYMAFVHSNSGKEVRKSCGGFLVRDNFVLTAAHCTGREITVILGAHNISKAENSQQIIPVLKAFPHKDYNNNSKFNDIMLLKLRDKAQLNWAVKTIALPRSQDWVRPGQVCSVAGWGRLESGKKPATLQEVDLEVQNEQKCKDLFKNYNNSIQLCMGNPKDKKATASGDSGGPLVCNNVAQGIVSFGKTSGKPPRVFTRISSFLPWIKRTLQTAGTRLRRPQD